MKFIGQYIQSFIARFRNDVFLEDVGSGTIASGGNLGLDSNNKIVKATISSTTDLASDVTGVLPVANGGTGSSSAGGAITNLGLNNANIITSGTLDVDVGGTGATSLTDNAVLLGNGTSAIEASAHLTYSNFAPGGGVDIDQLTIGDTNSTLAQVLTPGGVGMTVGPDASSGSNVAGASLTLQGGQSTGNAAGGSIRFLSSVTGTSGSVSNTIAEVAAFDSVGNLQLDGGITTGSTSFVNSSGIIQTAAQTNITSLGTLTTLTVDDITINGDTITASADLNIVATGDDINIDTDNFTIESSGVNVPNLTLKNTHSGGKGQFLTFVKDKGAAGADNDSVGAIRFTADDDAQTQTDTGFIMGTVADATAADFKGKISIGVAAIASSAGNNNTNVIEGVGSGNTITDVTIGAGATGVTTIAGTLTMGSTAFVNNSGVIQVATQGTIDHDSLANFVAAEHYRWDTDISSTATINAANIPTLNQDTTGTATNATKQIVVTTHNFQLNNTTGVKNYVPFNNLNESTGGAMSNYWTRTLAPYPGTIKKIAVRSQTSLGSSCTLRISKITDTTDALPSGTHVDNTGVDLSTAHTTVITTMSTNSFAAGDVVGVALERSAGTAAQVVLTIVWEYTT